MINSLVILNYNSADLTKKLIQKCINYKTINYIIIVDNNSSDNSIEILKELSFDKIHLINNNVNSGYARGNNIGLKYAEEKLKSDFVIVANPDIDINESTIIECLNVIGENSNCAIVAPKIKNINCFGNVAWKLSSYKNELFSLFYITNKLFNKNLTYKKEELEKNQMVVDVLPGSLLIMKISLMKNIDYFDENTFLYCEEKILAQKLRRFGYNKILVNTCSYIHEHGTIIKKEYKSKMKQYRILYDSKKYYLEKYIGCSKMQLFIFEVFSKVSILEKYIIEQLQRLKF